MACCRKAQQLYLTTLCLWSVQPTNCSLLQLLTCHVSQRVMQTMHANRSWKRGLLQIVLPNNKACPCRSRRHSLHCSSSSSCCYIPSSSPPSSSSSSSKGPVQHPPSSSCSKSCCSRLEPERYVAHVLTDCLCLTVSACVLRPRPFQQWQHSQAGILSRPGKTSSNMPARWLLQHQEVYQHSESVVQGIAGWQGCTDTASVHVFRNWKTCCCGTSDS